MNLNWKLLLASALTVLVGAVAGYIPLYQELRDAQIVRSLHTARVAASASEALRAALTEQWRLGLLTPEMLRAWGEAGEGDKIDAVLPVMAALRAGQMVAAQNGYRLRVASLGARRAGQMPDAVETRALTSLGREGLDEYYEYDETTHAVRYFKPIVTTQDCLQCHGDAAGGAERWGHAGALEAIRLRGNDRWTPGEVHGAFEVIQPVGGVFGTGGSNLWPLVAGLALCAMLVVLLVGLAADRLVVRRVRRLRDATQRINAGDLAHATSDAGADELGELARGIELLRSHYADVVGMIRDRGQQMVDATRSQVAGAKSQSTATAEITATMTELLEAARSMSDSGAQVAKQVEQSRNECVAGQAQVDRMVTGIEVVRGRVERIAERMVELGGQSRKISGALDIITELSEQTNLLSLNASIEAAGAGDAGQRFAVVAHEIRKLAERASESTDEIRELVAAVQGTVDTTTLATEEASKSVVAGVAITDELTEVFNRITASIDAAATSAKAIEFGIRQQQEAIEQVGIAVSDVDQDIRQTVTSAENIDAAAQALLTAADRIRAEAATG